ncbi:hypothetical protein RI367_005015 [Sorochytrium milnesiophthora]
MLAAVVCFLLAGYALHRLTRSNSSRRLPPSPNAVPLLGHLPLLASHPDVPGLFGRLRKQLGPLFHLKLGDTYAIVISDEDIAREAMIKQGGKFAGRSKLQGFWVLSEQGRNLGMAPPGEYWRKLRRAAHKVLAPGALDSLDHALDKESREFLAHILKESAEPRRPIDMSPQYPFFTTNIILGKALGMRFQSLDDPQYLHLMKVVKDIFEIMAVGGLYDYFPVELPDGSERVWWSKWMYKGLLAVLARPKMQRVKHLKRELQDNFLLPHLLEIQQQVEQQQKSDSDAQDSCYAEEMIRNKDELELSLRDIMLFLQDLVLGGVDTTSATLEWAALLLCRHPDVQRKAHDEIAQVTNGCTRLPDLKDMTAMPYVRALIKEVLRYKPVGPLGLPRATVEETQLAGYDIPNGTQVILNVPAIHDHSFAQGKRTIGDFPLDEFHPERFVTEREGPEASISTESFGTGELLNGLYSFGQGRRLCPGIHLAYRELFIMITRMLFAYEFQTYDLNDQPLSEVSMEAKISLVVTPKQPFKVLATPRIPIKQLHQLLGN